jgi:hypothetical protein
MPDWLYKQLRKGPKITKTKVISRSGGVVTQEKVEGETNGVLPVIRRLIENDAHSYMAYLCHPSVKQIGKDKNEGGFCGYRNIQMQVSYLQGAKAPGSEYFPGQTPGILELQEQIETAWDNNIHWYSRSQIGKLRGTRKWIGTLEVCWMILLPSFEFCLTLFLARLTQFIGTLKFLALFTSSATRRRNGLTSDF